jgi:glycosyltransferase involved in cell wall biosynthesis
MRIAFVSDNTYPWFNGGIEKRRFIIMRKLASEGNDVHCFTMHRPGMPGREFSYKGIRYHSVGEALSWQGMYRGGSKRRSIRMPLIFAFGLLQKIFPYRFDVLDADNFPFLHLFPLYLYTRIRGTRFAITWHEVWSKKFWKRYLRGVGMVGYFVEWFCSRIGDVHIANVSTTKELMVRELGVSPSKVVVLPVAIDSDEIRSFTRKRSYRRKKQFIVVSRLVKHKRVDLAISAVAKTRAKLIVVGIGPDLPELQELGKQLAPGRVSWLSNLPVERHYRLICESKALIMASEREGLSLVTVEALALGTPVVITTTSSLPKELRGMCIETSDVRMHELLERMLAKNAKYERASKKLQEKVIAEFSADNAEQVYENIAGR